MPYFFLGKKPRRVQANDRTMKYSRDSQGRSEVSDTSSLEEIHVDVENNDDSAIGLWSGSEQSSTNTESFSSLSTSSPDSRECPSPLSMASDPTDSLLMCSMNKSEDLKSNFDELLEPSPVKLELEPMNSMSMNYSEDMPSYGITSELFPNVSHDCMMDIPLFQEVDSLMNIKTEEHLNDTVFYLPMNGTESDISTQASEHFSQALAAVTSVTADTTTESSPLMDSDSSSTSSSRFKHLLPTGLVNTDSLSNSMEPVAAQEAVLNGNLAVLPVSRHTKRASKDKPRRASFGSIAATNMAASMTASSHIVCIKPHNEDEEVNIEEEEIPEKAHSEGSDCADIDITWMHEIRNGTNPFELSTLSSNQLTTQHSAPGVMIKQENIVQSAPPTITNSSVELLTRREKTIKKEETELEKSLTEVTCTKADDSYEVSRFVICSDNTMECVLCSFSTESYSAFKSHIICSHPCWRITKKLSKNRLLVEKSVRTTLSLAGGGLTSVGLNKAYLSKDDSVIPSKPKKEKVLPRKKQLFERNKRLFKCTVCLRMFVFEGSVVNHVMVQHRADQPYDYIHISTDHGNHFGPIYRCPQKNCFFSCESPGELDRHNTQRHLQVIFRCQLCGFTADSADAVRSHGIHQHQRELTRTDSTTIV